MRAKERLRTRAFRRLGSPPTLFPETWCGGHPGVECTGFPLQKLVNCYESSTSDLQQFRFTSIFGWSPAGVRAAPLQLFATRTSSPGKRLLIPLAPPPTNSRLLTFRTFSAKVPRQLLSNSALSIVLAKITPWSDSLQAPSQRLNDPQGDVLQTQFCHQRHRVPFRGIVCVFICIVTPPVLGRWDSIPSSAPPHCLLWLSAPPRASSLLRFIQRRRRDPRSRKHDRVASRDSATRHG